ncbi:hypothetical protein [Novosphingobium flavum]|uniref:hypothetical protein n=1 Tax=Novosphingobium flavum TaxID=1778672 RepID=UPI002483CFCE|nr:hypothetical protein [Novosphingobium flavum]
MRTHFVTSTLGMAAALSMALAAPALAAPGGGKGGGGGGGGHGGGGPAHGGGAERGGGGGGGGGNHGGGQAQHAQQSHGGGKAAHAQQERGGGRQAHASGPAKASHASARSGGRGSAKSAGHMATKGNGRASAGPGNSAKAMHKAAVGAAGVGAVAGAAHPGSGGGERVSFRGERPNMLGGCPPGLAKKYNGCNPPGLVKQAYVPWRADWWGYGDSGYRYFDGYLLRTSGVSILGYVPLLGGALFIGEMWPVGYETAPLPVYYDRYYDLGPDYRYYDDTFYRLEPSGRIVGVAGFMTGDEFIVGQPIPVGYGVYNVPWDYRDRYYDGPDAYYRYADGYIYRVDPRTRLILAAIELLS